MNFLRDEIDSIDWWLHRHKSRRPLAIFLGASVDGLAMVRSLGRRGIPVLLLNRGRQCGSWTRFARTVALEGTLRQSEGVLEFLTALGQRLPGPGVIFPTSDCDSLFIANHQDELEHYYKFLQPQPETLYAMVDETKQRRVVSQLGVAVLADDVSGDDSETYGYCGFWDEEATERACVTTRVLRLNARRTGGGSLKQTVAAPDVAKLSRTVLRAFEYRGLVTVECRRDARDGSLRLVRIIPRAEGGTQLAITAGVDLAWIAYRHLTVGPMPRERAPFTPGVTYINEEADFETFLASQNSDGLKASEWLRAWFSARSYALGAWDDPMPLIALVSSRARLGLHAKRLRLVLAGAPSSKPLEQRKERARTRTMPERDHADVG